MTNLTLTKLRPTFFSKSGKLLGLSLLSALFLAACDQQAPTQAQASQSSQNSQSSQASQNPQSTPATQSSQASNSSGASAPASTAATAKDLTIRIGSKDFTENLLVSELYALALSDAGYKVQRVQNIAGSVVHQAITSNQIDLYPEYTGTGLLSVLQLPLETDPQLVYQRVKDAYLEKFNLVWLNYAPANDSQGLVVSKAAADKYNLKTISDLQAQAANLRLASQGEFDLRADGLAGLAQVYGPFDFKSKAVFANALKYRLLENNQADVAPAYTTEGQLSQTEKFVLLADDKHFWPPYNLAPVVRKEILEQDCPTSNQSCHGQVEYVLNKLSALLTTPVVTKLNAQVDVEGKEYPQVAKDYYQQIKAQLSQE